MNKLDNLIIVTGHYGSGKTNFAINLAVDLAGKGKKVTLADLDIVNPYFRAADFEAQAEEHGIKLILPPYANSNVDMPILTGAIDAAINKEDGVLILDVGGDDAGAFALGRYAEKINRRPYSMLYVVNPYRPMTTTTEEAAMLMNNIEVVSRLKTSFLVNNPNLGEETSAENIEESFPYIKDLEQQTGVPILTNVIKKTIIHDFDTNQPLFRVKIYVVTPWSQGEI